MTTRIHEDVLHEVKSFLVDFGFRFSRLTIQKFVEEALIEHLKRYQDAQETMRS